MRPPHDAPAKDVQEPTVYGEGDLDYNAYLKVPELTRLQKPQSKPAHPDEMLFIIIHQAYELWFKLMIHEVEIAIRNLTTGHARPALHALRRCGRVMDLLVKQIHLLETMRPIEFLEFRDHLKPASGFQSQQFRELEFLCGLHDRSYLKYFDSQPAVQEQLAKRLDEPNLRDAYYELLRKKGNEIPMSAGEGELHDPPTIDDQLRRALVKIYGSPDDFVEAYQLAEALLDLDEAFQLWREHHVRVVERIIGGKRGTGGSSGVSYLRATTSKKCFPALWDVRSHLGATQS